ncbi:MAG: IS110 family transposase [Acidimicrobiia bacterium]
MIFVGHDWSEDHHDIWVMDHNGDRLVSRRLPEGLEGVAELHELVGDYATDPAEVVVGTETDRGLWVGALVGAGYEVYAVNPKSVARYRQRHRPGGGKSDRGDAKLLADLVRTDRHNHRRVAGDTAEAVAVGVVARAHQKLIWERKRHLNRLRSTLREYYPQGVVLLAEGDRRDALAVLAKAPSPTEGARLSTTQIRAALRAWGRQRGVDKHASEIRTILGAPGLTARGPVEEAMAATTRAAVAIIAELDRQIGDLEVEITQRFEQHPDAPIYLSMPGIGITLGARVLGEFGDDPDRYADVKSRRNYAGTSPLTNASGKKHTVTARWVRNNRLYDPLIRWAFCSLIASPGCRTFYDQHRAKGDTHYQALRALANRLVGILHGCLRHRTPYNEDTAWAHRQPLTTNVKAA